MSTRKGIAIPESFQSMLEYLRSMHYKESTMYYYESQFRTIARFLEENGYEAYTYQAYTSHLATITKGRGYQELRSLEKRHVRTANILYQFQLTGGFTYRRKKEEEAFQNGIKDEIEEFLAYRASLLHGTSTQQQYRLDLLRFNRFLNDKEIVTATSITSVTILEYIQQRMSCFTQATIRHALTSIRQLLLYLYRNGKTVQNLSLVVPQYGATPTKKLPSTYTKEEIDALLGAMNRADAKRKRDYAMILMASKLGLRSSDICGLKFSELDWKENRIVLRQKKTDVPIELPLLSEIGEAIIDYLKYGRPKSQLSYVFLKHMPPYDGVTGAAFTNAIKVGIRDAAIPHVPQRKRGPHALRHSLANALLEQNTPLPVITEILGHQDPEATKVYLGIDLGNLCRCALHVPDLPSDYYYGRSGK